MNKPGSITEPQDKTYSYRDLPTEWLIISPEGKILSTDISAKSEDEVARVLVKDPTKRYLLAKCHYRKGSDGEKQFITQLEMIPEALKKRPELDYPFGSPIVQIYRYGERQIDVNTGIIKGLDK